MDYLKQNHLSIAVVVFLVVSAFMGGSTNDLGALDRTTFTNPVTFSGAVTHSGTLTQTGDATFSGGDGAIVVTTSNTATSSVEVGCIQMTATSTATPIKLVFGNGSGASSAATTTFGGTMIGLAGFAYGTCP